MEINQSNKANKTYSKYCNYSVERSVPDSYRGIYADHCTKYLKPWLVPSCYFVLVSFWCGKKTGFYMQSISELYTTIREMFAVKNFLGAGEPWKLNTQIFFYDKHFMHLIFVDYHYPQNISTLNFTQKFDMEIVQLFILKVIPCA